MWFLYFYGIFRDILFKLPYSETGLNIMAWFYKNNPEEYEDKNR